ncbi:MAG: gamma-glutamyl-gamma-aminobutyrate hydrolase family protein [Holophaga sp.]|nr:gamma-glutamyl-gamma-aminobutyrate hydrolase family protein [Holophaga sp.]
MSSIVMACGDKSGAEKYYLPALRLGGWIGTVHIVAPGDALPDLDGMGGLLVCGGGDIHPRQWDVDETLHPTAVPDEARDTAEPPLILRAWEAGLPILGICRGEQMLNVALGGSLIQDIPSHFGCEPDVHRHGSAEVPDRHHLVQLDPSSRMAALVGSLEFPVNSRHHQAVKRVASGLKAVGWHRTTSPLESGPVIEAIEAEDPNRWVFGVQWHPENLVGLDDACGAAARRFFEGFVGAVQRL